MSENKSPNLPPNLQERMEKLAEQQSERLTSSLVDADSRARHFKAGYRQAYAEIMQELRPVVEALRSYGYNFIHNPDSDNKTDQYWTDEGIYDHGQIAREALKHLKERILPEERTGG